MKKILFVSILSFILSSCANDENLASIKNTNLLQETNLQENLGNEFNEIFNLLSDNGIKAVSKTAKMIEINGYKILYSNPDEIFILKNKEVLARINDNDRFFYNSNVAPLSGEQVILKKDFISYHNNSNSFIDHGIDGVDIIEENHFKFLREAQKKQIPNSSFVNGNKCNSSIEGLARVACCGKVGYTFSLDKGWLINEKLTKKCQSINK